jgi:hypothetical protein
MAVSKYFMTKTLQLRLNTGLDAQFNPIFRNRSWSNIKADATDQELFDLAGEIGALQVHGIDGVRTVTTEGLEQLG